MSVGVLTRGQSQDPMIHDQLRCSTVLEGEKLVLDPVTKQQKTQKYNYTCKEPISHKNARTCASCGVMFCSKATCIFPDVELARTRSGSRRRSRRKKSGSNQRSSVRILQSCPRGNEGCLDRQGPKTGRRASGPRVFGAFVGHDIPASSDRRTNGKREGAAGKGGADKLRASRICSCMRIGCVCCSLTCLRTKNFKTKSTNSWAKFRLDSSRGPKKIEAIHFDYADVDEVKLYCHFHMFDRRGVPCFSAKFGNNNRSNRFEHDSEKRRGT